MPRIITLTLNPALDLSVEVDKVVPEDKLRASSALYDPGGGGINVARVINRLEGEALALYPSGGHTGRILDELLEAEGVPIESIPAENPTRENFSAFERSTRKQYRFVLPGAPLKEVDIRTTLDRLAYLIPGSEYAVASGSLPAGTSPEVYAEAARIARRRRVKLFVDTSGPALVAALKEGVFAVKPNGKEFEKLATEMGYPPESARNGALARKLLESGAAEIIALTLGADGAILFTREGQISLRPPAIEVNSSVGAGDSFVGGFVCGLTRGHDLRHAFAYGMAAAASTMLTPGTHLCTREPTERFFKEILSS